ncbi:Protein argonaute 9 [Abeliophyllum distichum]|uniref:Protein argonaute 9 n=1 Tax=Abeliophyllum distichum TaxID=126358 RepID=A0ABD1NU00_9LAMI
MRWHNTGRSRNDADKGHHVDGKAWRAFDKNHPDFACEIRNVRLGLSSDGFNPFGNMSQSYISDFPTRSSLSGWSGQGYDACPTFNEETPSTCVIDLLEMEASKDVASPPAKRVPMERRGYASIGENKIQLLTNHFKVRKVLRAMEWFYHYSVSITYEDGTIVDPRNVGRRIMKNLQEEFITELNGKEFAYDGDKSLYTVCEPLPRAKLEFHVVLLNPISIRKLESADLGGDDNPKESVKKRSRGFSRFKTYKVAINLVGVIPIDAAATALRGQDSNLYQDPELFQKAVRVLNVILQQNAAKRGCFLVHQSFFHNEPKNFMDIGGGVVGCRGFHSSFRATQGGLSLNIADVSTTLLVKPGSVMDFLLGNQRVKYPNLIKWDKALNSSNYNADPLLLSSRISINEEFTRVQGRILAPPMLTVGNDNFIPRNGRWNFNKRDLISCGRKKGMLISEPIEIFEEKSKFQGRSALNRVKKMIGMVMSKVKNLKFLLCILSERKNSKLYGPWKRKCLCDIGVVTQCSEFTVVVVYRYHAAVRIQTPKQEMIESLFQKVSDTKDNGIFRDGVSESQFNQVLNIEFNQIIEACKFLGADNWSPKFMLIVAQKNHHTKFFQADDSPDNVPPGTVVEHTICHPKYNDFYMCAHAGVNGTTRPTHYHVLVDEIGYCPTDLQELVHCLSYANQRSTTAISVVAPIRYAHLAASQMSQLIKFDVVSSSHGGLAPVPELPALHKNVSTSMFFC